MICTEDGCDRLAAVELHISGDENRVVCAEHARTIGRQDGVITDPLPDGSESSLE